MNLRMIASNLCKVGLDFTTEVLWYGVGCQLEVKDFESGPVVGVIGLNGSPGDDPDEKLMSGFTRDGVD